MTRPGTMRAAREVPDPAAALEIALRFLGTRPRTRWEIERRLRRAAAEEPTIGAVVERLAELGYVDDAAFARWWIEQRDRHAPRGRRLLDAELRQRGVPREVLDGIHAEMLVGRREPSDDEPAAPSNERERAVVALAGHLRGRDMPPDRRAIERVGTYLMRRGFDRETVVSVLREATERRSTE